MSFDLSNGTMDYAKEASLHDRGTLPPSLSGIPNDIAFIRYFLKATVNRPAFYKTNLRKFDPFVFLPIEPPRPPPSGSEAFARRKHEFISPQEPKKPSMFSVFRKPVPVAPTIPCRFSIEARLPSPPILVPNEPLPLRLILNKFEAFRGVIVIRSLQISLLGTTRVRAHQLFKDEFSTWVIFTVTNIHIPFGDENSLPNVELVADSGLWHDKCLPDIVAPSFTTCNISRSYQLQIDIGLSQAGDHHFDVRTPIPPHILLYLS